MAYQRGKTEFHDKLADMIAKNGWAVVSILAGEDTPQYSYTVGLGQKGLPELILFGLDQNIARTLLNDLAGRVVAGLALNTGDRLTDLATIHMVLVELSEADAKASLLAATVFADNFKAFQVVWPDPSGKFPWENGYDRNWLKIQPVKRLLQ